MNPRLPLLLILPGVLLAAETPAVPAAKPAVKVAPRRTLAQLAEDKRALAAELVALTRVEKQITAGAAEFHANLDGQLNAGLKGPAASQKPLVEEYRAKLHAIISEGLDWKLMKAEIVKAHADAFSEDELKGLVAFFNSPVGKAYADRNAALTGAISGVTGKRMQEIQPRIQSSFYELDLRIRQALQAAGVPAAPPHQQQGGGDTTMPVGQ